MTKTYENLNSSAINSVIIEDNVDIGSSSTIDRATLGATIIRSGVKLDNQVQIAHNVEIGKNTAIAAQTGIAGSTKVGENCMIGGQVGFAGHLIIGNNVKIGSGTILHDSDHHELDPERRRYDSEHVGENLTGVIVEDDVFIGANCTILKNVRIGEGSIIAAAAAASLIGIKSPDTLFSIISTAPPCCVATTGRPAAIASVTTAGAGSGSNDGKINTSSAP